VPDIFLVVFGAVLGLAFGSFGTVIAYRVPRKESIVSGRSRCPNCGRTITAVENIPLFSYLIQRGKCRGCGNRISPRYPLTELATGVLFALTFLKFDFTLEAFVYSFFFWVLVVLSAIDLETKRLPDVVTGPALLLGWVGLLAISILRNSFGAFSWVSIVGGIAAFGIALLSYDFRPRPDEASEPEPEQKSKPVVEAKPEQESKPVVEAKPEPESKPVVEAKPEPVAEQVDEKDFVASARPAQRKTIGLNPFGALLLALWLFLFIASFFDGTRYFIAGAASGAAIFAGFFFSMVVLYSRGMGLGDAKLGLLLGSFTGFLGSPDLVVVSLFLAFVVGGIGGGVHIALGGSRKDPIPFGPFLALGAALSVFIGQDLVDAYNNLLGG
jgi:prepilin signal peptidase PulO-like enzyme (type II secretory pathway)